MTSYIYKHTFSYACKWHRQLFYWYPGARRENQRVLLCSVSEKFQMSPSYSGNGKSPDLMSTEHDSGYLNTEQGGELQLHVVSSNMTNSQVNTRARAGEPASCGSSALNHNNSSLDFNASWMGNIQSPRGLKDCTECLFQTLRFADMVHCSFKATHTPN